jgi:hypothetical protein
VALGIAFSGRLRFNKLSLKRHFFLATFGETSMIDPAERSSETALKQSKSL